MSDFAIHIVGYFTAFGLGIVIGDAIAQVRAENNKRTEFDRKMRGEGPQPDFPFVRGDSVEMGDNLPIRNEYNDD